MTDDNESDRATKPAKAPRGFRYCPRCGVEIPVGKEKTGRSVFKGGICYACWVRAGKPGRAKK